MVENGKLSTFYLDRLPSSSLKLSPGSLAGGFKCIRPYGIVFLPVIVTAKSNYTEKMNDLRALLKHDLQLLRSAEEQIVEAMPAMVARATNPG